MKTRVHGLYESLRHYAPLTVYMTLALMKKEAAGTFGGFLWWIAEPVFYFFVYYFVFTVVFHTRTENYIAFLLVGLVVWRWFTVVVNYGTLSIIKNRAIIRQVDVPKILFPLQAVLMETYKFLAGLAVLTVFLAATGSFAFGTACLFPVVFALALALFSGIVLVTSAIAPFFPDVANLVRMSFRGLLFVSGVFYDGSRIPEKYRELFYLNPLASLLDLFRDVLIYGRVPAAEKFAAVLFAATVFLVAGLWMHVRLNRVIPRYLMD